MLNATKKLLAFISYPFFTFHLALGKVVSRRILKKETMFNISNTVYKTWFILRKFNFEQNLETQNTEEKGWCSKLETWKLLAVEKKFEN